MKIKRNKLLLYIVWGLDFFHINYLINLSIINLSYTDKKSLLYIYDKNIFLIQNFSNLTLKKIYIH